MSMSKVLKDVKNLIFEDARHGYGGIDTIGMYFVSFSFYFIYYNYYI